MSLTGVLDLLVGTGGDPALRAALDAARAGGRADLDLTAPPGIRPFALAALAARAGRPVLAVTATGREAEELATSLRDLLEPSSVVEFPAWETLPHERLSPRSDTVGRRLAVLRRLAHPDAARRRARPGAGRGRAGARGAAADGRRPRRPRAGGAEAGRRGRPGRRRRAARGRRLHPRRPGRAARGVRRPRRDPRRLPADRGAPAAGRVLGRHRRGGALVQGRRPAVARGRRARPVGAAVPGAAAHRRGARARRRPGRRAPGPGRRARQARRGHRGRGHGVAGPAPGRRDGAAARRAAGRHPRRAADPERVRTRAHDLFATSQEFLEASWANAAAGAATPVDLGAAAYRSLAEVRARAGELGLPWWSISPFAADEVPDDEETSVVAARGVEGYRGDTARALADVKGWLGDGWRVVLLTEGHGPAQRVVEVLAGEDIPARLDDDAGRRTRARPGARVVRLPRRTASSARRCGSPS